MEKDLEGWEASSAMCDWISKEAQILTFSATAFGEGTCTDIIQLQCPHLISSFPRVALEGVQIQVTHVSSCF